VKLYTDGSAGTLEVTDYAYNFQGRMSTVTINSNGDNKADTQLQYEYNDNGIRTAHSKTTDGNADGDFNDVEDTVERTDYLVDEHNPTGYAQVFEESLDGTLVKTYTIGHDVFAEAISTAVRHLLKDGHGSTRMLVDAAGLPLSGQVYRFDAYGNAIGFIPADALTTLLYNSEQFDHLSGLSYLRARYYDPAAGRFNRLDPFFGNLHDPQSLHKYLFTPADPVNFSDHSGEFFGLAGGMVLQAALRGMKWGATVGAVIGGVRGLGDAWLDNDAGWGDVAWGTTWGAAQGLIAGGAFGFLGPYLGGLHWAIQLSVVGGLTGYGIQSGYAAYCQSLSEKDYDQAAWRGGWLLIDSIMGVFGMSGVATIKAGNKSSNWNGGTQLPEEASISLHATQFSTVKWLLAKAGVTVSRQPHSEATRPFWVKPDDIGAYHPRTKEIWLRHDATWYVFMHETFHAVHHRIAGSKYVHGSPENEQVAYNLLKNFFWGMMNDGEQAHARAYVIHEGGVP
jgi:RHS repeat-associated protein